MAGALQEREGAPEGAPNHGANYVRYSGDLSRLFNQSSSRSDQRIPIVPATE